MPERGEDGIWRDEDGCVVEDLGLLFVCGRPGHTPDQLIEASWDGGPVNVSNAEEISDPVRLTQPEAAALMIGLQTLRSLPGQGTTVALWLPPRAEPSSPSSENTHHV